MNKAAAVFLGALPFAAMCFSVPLWDRIYPMVLGLPFNLFWLICWVVLTSGCMALSYALHVRRERGKGQ